MDAVTSRGGNVITELLNWLERPIPEVFTTPSLCAAAARVRRDSQSHLELWPERISLGEILPILPLWLDEQIAVPVDFEDTYTAACSVLRIASPSGE